MKNKSTVTIGVVIFTVMVIAIIIISLVGAVAYNTQSPVITATAINTNIPVATFTPDACAPNNIKSVVLDFNRNARAFDDLSVLAQNTPREQLVPIITQLQDIRRASEDFVAPVCMVTLQKYQLAYMNTFIDTLVALYSSLTAQLTENDVALINQGMTLAVQYHDQYLIEMARLLGVTLVPTPITIPIATATP